MSKPHFKQSEFGMKSVSSTEGTMKIGEGEELLLIERDEGDGWTRVRK